MRQSVKFAVSIPEKEFKDLEAFRKKRGVTRSKLVLEAFELWKEVKRKERLTKVYEDGYKRVPESLEDVEAWERASVSVFSQEEW